MTTTGVAPESARPRTTPASLALRAANTAAGSDHVVIATLNRLDGMTGVHAHTRSMSEGLRQAGFACDVVTTFSGSRAWTPIFAVRPLLLKRLFPTAATLWYRHWHTAALRANLRRALRSGTVKHVIAQCPPSARAAMDVRQKLGLAGRVGVSMVCHFNESEADEYRDQGTLSGRAYDRVKADEERVLREVDRVLYVSSWARERVEVARQVATRSSAVIWNGIAADAPGRGTLRRSDIGLTDDDLVLINVGTLEPRKDQAGLLNLFARVAAEFPAAKLVLIGEGPDRPVIDAAARELGIADKVKLLGRRHDVPALLDFADLYVHYAALENCPIALIEASRAALPWAAKPSGGVPGLIDGLGGVALDDESIDASIAALRPLLKDRARRQAAGRASRDLFIARFTQDAMVQAYAAALGLRGAL